MTGPTNSVGPSVTGSATIGSRLTCNRGTWAGSPTFAYTWLRNGVAIPGQTQATYTAARADAGQLLQCAVRASANGLTTAAQSTAFGGPPRLVILTTTALVSRSGTLAMKVGCFGPTACRIPRASITYGKEIARSGAHAIRADGTSSIVFTLARRGAGKLRRAGSSITARFTATPSGGNGVNARIQLVALRGTRTGETHGPRNMPRSLPLLRVQGRAADQAY
jgi:hypothetical protein